MKTWQKIALGAVAVEITTELVSARIALHRAKRNLKKAGALTTYLTQMIVVNDTPMTEYDRIAISTILD